MFQTVRLALALAFLSAAARSAVCGQTAPPVVAILDFTNSALRDHDAYAAAETGVAGLLLAELHEIAGIQLVERERLDEVLAEIELGRSGPVAPGTAARVGELLGAQYVITGVFVVDRGGTLRVDARAIHVESGRVVHTETVIGRADDLVEAVDRLGGQLGAALSLPPGDPTRPTDEADFVRARRLADLRYARALREEDRQNTDAAVRLYRAFLDACPPGYAPDLQRRARSRLSVLSSTLFPRM